MNIKKFTLNKVKHILTIEFIGKKAKSATIDFSFEFLRVFSPTPANNKQTPLVCHKKQVKLITIEPVGKHGYRFIFDDEHSEIYDSEYLLRIAEQQTQLWQQYLAAIKQSGHSREAMIDITQL